MEPDVTKAEQDSQGVKAVLNPYLTMQPERREKTREELVKLYFDQAFQFIIDAEYEMTFLPEKRNKLEQNLKEIDQLKAEIKSIEESPEHHIRQNRDIVKLKSDEILRLEADNRGLDMAIKNVPESLINAYERANNYIKKAEFIIGYDPKA